MTPPTLSAGAGDRRKAQSEPCEYDSDSQAWYYRAGIDSETQSLNERTGPSERRVDCYRAHWDAHRNTFGSASFEVLVLALRQPSDVAGLPSEDELSTAIWNATSECSIEACRTAAITALALVRERIGGR